MMRLRSFWQAIDRKPTRDQSSAPERGEARPAVSRVRDGADAAVVGMSCNADGQVGTVGSLVPWIYRFG